ncbi:MAG: Ca2+-transporting ATPase, partial [Pirellulaceae bacterium]
PNVRSTDDTTGEMAAKSVAQQSWHALSCEAVKDSLQTDVDRGLTQMAFLGTTITDGRGRLLVTATGAETEVGKIGILIDEAMTRATPLEQKLARLGRLLIVVVLGLCAVIVLAGWLRGVTDFWHMLEMGLSLAIAAVPEGLPAVTTMTLGLGMQRMARMRALVRRLPAVETLGSVTVICTDKTGTLTKNEMTVCVLALDQRRVDVTGIGYAPVGEFRDGAKSVDPRSDEQLALAARIGMLCNDAKVERTDVDNTVLGDPTEAALVVVAEKAGMNQAAMVAEFPRLSEVPFDSASKRRREYIFKEPHLKKLTESILQFQRDGFVPLQAIVSHFAPQISAARG